MIQINQIKLPCGADGGPTADTHPQLEARLHKVIRIPKGRTAFYRILRHSVDARKRPVLYDVYSIGIYIASGKVYQDSPWLHGPYTGKEDTVLEERIVHQAHQPNVLFRRPVTYQFPQTPDMAPVLFHRPVVIGEGPAGLFCAIKLAEAGYRPIVMERGRRVTDRVADVEAFWATGRLHPQSNIQFGEGGAGTFSDGKINSGVTDKAGRCEEVIRQFIAAGAHPDIAYEYHPHIGTDVLRRVVQNLRERLEELGGEVWFETTMTGIITDAGSDHRLITGIRYRQGDTEYELPAEAVVLAIGHSARDTFRALYAQQVPMEQKNYAIGFRMSHPQRLVDQQQYGISDPIEMQRLHLEHSSYKLVAQNPSGKAVYSFCMCPGGYVVNASSEEGRLCVNGMSDNARDSLRANSAIVVTVGAEDYGGEHVLDGLVFQEQLEERAYTLADGAIPVQRYLDFKDGQTSTGEADARELCVKGRASFAALHTLLPQGLTQDIITGMERFDRMIPGYAGEEAYVIGLESRTSSPVRIPRDGSGQCVGITGLFPCGEGAGYAGGIMSAAVDGIKTAESVAMLFRPHTAS